jgi:hypothetical protein
MQSDLLFLKAMLIVLTSSFLIRAVLLSVIMYLFKVRDQERWKSELETFLLTSYLLFGELVPIAFVFFYHLT